MKPSIVIIFTVLIAPVALADKDTAPMEEGMRATLRKEILAMSDEDQLVRARAPFFSRIERAEMRRTDGLHELRMKAVVAQHGWPGKSLVGVEAATRAWLIVQHC